jgi:hypothetical protein
MLALANWMKSKIAISVQLKIAISTTIAAQIMAGIGCHNYVTASNKPI